MKKAIATTGVIGGLATAGTATADHDDTQVTISGTSSDATGSYVVYVNEPDAHGKEETLEDDDGVRCGSSRCELSGTIDKDDEMDVYVYNGEITTIYLKGNLELEVENPNINVYGTVSVSGDPGANYAFCAREGSVEEEGDLESCDNVGSNCANGCINSISDEDYYDISGVITFAKNTSENENDYILLEYDIDSE